MLKKDSQIFLQNINIIARQLFLLFKKSTTFCDNPRTYTLHMISMEFIFPGGATELKFSDLAPRPVVYDCSQTAVYHAFCISISFTFRAIKTTLLLSKNSRFLCQPV